MAISTRLRLVRLWEIRHHVYLHLLELGWCIRPKTNVSSLFMRSCTSAPGALPTSAGNTVEGGILTKAQECPTPRLEQLLHGYLRSQRILARLVSDGCGGSFNAVNWQLLRKREQFLHRETGFHLLALSTCVTTKLRLIPTS